MTFPVTASLRRIQNRRKSFGSKVHLRGFEPLTSGFVVSMSCVSPVFLRPVSLKNTGVLAIESIAPIPVSTIAEYRHERHRCSRSERQKTSSTS